MHLQRVVDDLHEGLLRSEKRADAFARLTGVTVTQLRYHNVYGPEGTYDGGREKAPAAICRKVIAAKLSGKHEIEIWGDGQQTRDYVYVDDVVEALAAAATASTVDRQVINVGSGTETSVSDLAGLVGGPVRRPLVDLDEKAEQRVRELLAGVVVAA